MVITVSIQVFVIKTRMTKMGVPGPNSSTQKRIWLTSTAMTPPRLLIVCFLAGICAVSVTSEKSQSEIIDGARQNFEGLAKELEENLVYLDGEEVEGSGNDAEITTVASSSEPPSTPDNGATVAATTPTDGLLTASPINTASTETVVTSSGGSTQEPASTITSKPSSDTTTQVSNGPGSTAAEPATTTQAPTTTTLPPTTAEPWETFYLDCDNTTHTCVYTIGAPQLNESIYNSEVNTFDTENGLYLRASAQTYGISQNFTAHGVEEKLQNLTATVESLESELDVLVEKIATMESDTLDAANYIARANVALNDSSSGVFGNTASCYAQTCSRATPKPTTTSTTPRPTTLGPCATNKCDAAGFEGECTVINNKPVCKCPGNLDGKNHCAQASCYPDRIGVYDGTVPGPFWTPNYTKDGNQTYEPNLNCVWKISADSGNNLVVTSKVFSIDSATSISVNGKKIPYTLTNDRAQLFLNTYVSGQPYVTITFKSGPTRVSNHFINWEFTQTEITPSMYAVA
uniref:CUB domain-containing protein n=1 Tax=Panagrellus redivivus TaxID=6233 RepID=A0A7E4VJV7_PANRE